uniref:hypothetical protein n=1 Tax=Flavobacterium sp. TaxID=239 RepID=UPI00404ABAD6
MKKAYLLKCYDDLLHLIDTYSVSDSRNILDELLKKESESYRIYAIQIISKEDVKQLKIQKPVHSFHPKAPKLELKSLFQINELNNHIFEIKRKIKFTGEAIFFANDPIKAHKFYIYEKCSIEEIAQKERLFLYCYQQSLLENKTIKLAIKDKVFELDDAEKIKHFINKNQVAIDCQLNILYANINPDSHNELYQFSNEYTKSDCLKAIYGNYEKILLFLENEYNDYLNEHKLIPKTTLKNKEIEIKTVLDFVRDSLLASEINQELLTILFEPILLANANNHQNGITYYQFNYAKEYIFELAKRIKTYPDAPDEKVCYNWLLVLNNNSFKFFDYVTNQLKKDIYELDSDSERLEYLYKKLKKFRQINPIIKTKFKQDLPIISIQTSNWIEEEIVFLNRKIKLKTKKGVLDKPTDEPNKILINFSVAQISYMLNMMVQTEIIKHDNNRDIFRMVAQNMKTSTTDNISIDSLSSKFYNVEQSTKEALRLKLIEMLNLTKQ